MFERTGLPDGEHTIKIETDLNFGQAVAWINVDAFETSQGSIDDDGVPYIFYVDADDGARLTVNATTVVDQWATRNGSVEWTTGPVKLLRGANPLELTVFKETGNGAYALKWSSPFEAEQDIPAARLFP